MKSYLPLLLLPAIALICTLTEAQSRGQEKATRNMAKAADSLLTLLTPEQKAKAMFAFTDAERTNWHFVPIERKGLPLKEMDEKQKAAAITLLKTGLSQKGYVKATTIMAMENVLKALEKGTGPLRDSERYFVSFFGMPPFSESKPWGWRFEGHHLALNVTIVKGKVAASPNFFGSNPAEIRVDDGGMKGTRVLKDEEEAARALLTALTPEQQKIALYDTAAPNDILTGDKKKITPLESKGIAYKDLTGAQKTLLEKLIAVHTGNMATELARERTARLTKADKSKIVFAWAGETERGKRHYYRVQGPTFLIEYDNTQNNANHIHSVWRDFDGDFGADLLAEHYATDPHRN